jgi:hypothetical protein
MNVAGLRRASDFVTADVCCKVVLNALFSYNFMALVAEMSAFIIYAVNVMKNALREGLLRPKCSLNILRYQARLSCWMILLELLTNY